MSFSSPGFLFAFLPAFFLLYFALPVAIRNIAVLAGSLIFYSIDGGYVTAVLIASIFVNQLIGVVISRTTAQNIRSRALWCGVVLNLAPLIYYKYWTFILSVTHDALTLIGINLTLAPSNIILPAGISFFTFQGLSYLVDIYRGEIAPAKSIIVSAQVHFPA